MSVGLTPANADDLNMQLGGILRRWIEEKESIGHWEDWLGSTDLKVPPYEYTPQDEALIKSAVHDLDAALDAIDLTFITRLVGPF